MGSRSGAAGDVGCDLMANHGCGGAEDDYCGLGGEGAAGLCQVQAKDHSDREEGVA